MLLTSEFVNTYVHTSDVNQSGHSNTCVAVLRDNSISVVIVYNQGTALNQSVILLAHQNNWSRQLTN